MTERPSDRVEPRIGGADDVAWITGATRVGLTIEAAVPAVFAAYATVVIPDDDADGEGVDDGRKAAADAALVEVLRRHTPPQPWWLGYLETGVADLVFPAAPRTLLYPGWPYVLVEGGPDQALHWRGGSAVPGRHTFTPWHSPLPELIFPADHGWLVSTLWDDDWRCVGGPAALVDDLLADPRLEARAVAPGEDATPPGHEAR